MSSISSLGGGTGAWSPMLRGEGPRPREKPFQRADGDGSGRVDGEELKALLAKAAERSGDEAVDAGTVMGSFDADGDGGLDEQELGKAMRSLMPPPSSTVEFAQRGPGGPPPEPPPEATDDTQALSASGPAALGEALQQLLQAADSDGDGSFGESEVERLQQALSEAWSAETASGDGSKPPSMTALVERMLAAYGQTASDSAALATDSSADSGVDLSV